MMEKSLQYINLAYLNDVSEGDMNLLKEMIEIFIRQVPEITNKMNLYFENKDWISLSKVAHQAKSSVSIMGMNKLAKQLKKFENNARDEKDIDKYPEFIEKFTNECNKAVYEAKNISLNL